MRRRHVLDRCHEGLRLDQALAQLVPDLSRARLQKLVRRGDVRVDGRTVRRSNGQVRAGSQIELELEDRVPPVLHEDDALIVVDKPPGLLTHRIPGNEEANLADLLDTHSGPLPTGAGAHRPGVVHRLDRETSGVIVLARTEAALRDLKLQFREHRVDKRYLALCVGEGPREPWHVDRPLGPAPTGGDREWLDPPQGGKPAHTEFRVLRRTGSVCWVEARPRSGRRHQVRLHLVASGLSVVDDRLYRAKDAPAVPTPARVGRCALHAATLEFVHPERGERVRFEAPLPDDLAAALERSTRG
jgi:23S rRNA pseudouridine1911/1915/1917 synthase